MTPLAAHEGWRDIVKAVRKALRWPLMDERTVRRYEQREEDPLPVGTRGNGVRFLEQADLDAWAARWLGKSGQRRLAKGDRRRSRRMSRTAQACPP